MPQIGWFEILIVVVLSILIIGPKDFPIVLKKMGNWIGSLKRYFTDIQKDLTDMDTVVEDQISLKKQNKRKFQRQKRVNFFEK